MSQIFKSRSLEETKKIAANLAKEILTKKKTTLLFFCGDMGSGKTTFIKALGESLGVKEKITSPTFVGQNEYYSSKLPLVHIDAYQSQLDYGDLNELIEEKLPKVIAIEWTENLDADFLSKLKQDPNLDIFELNLKSDSKDENLRSIEII